MSTKGGIFWTFELFRILELYQLPSQNLRTLETLWIQAMYIFINVWTSLLVGLEYRTF